MSCWRVLQLSDSNDSSVPQLLIKPVFRPDSYTVFLTDLSNIWSEELGLDGILDRASKLESPIEVSHDDKSQLSILLDHVKQSLMASDGSNRQLTKGDSDEIVLHTTNRLPDPLGSLAWTFNLRKRNPAILKNELILPLLVSSHIQHERVNELLAIVREKDRAITRFVDQFESSNIDLGLAFPSLAPMRTGRRAVKREQAARHIPALQPFDDDNWMQETAELKDGHVSTLGLFQEALSECNPKVPVEMASEDADNLWWGSLDSQLSHEKAVARKTKKQARPPPKLEEEEDETDTEDDFETHPNFKLRQTQKQRSETPMQTGAAGRKEPTPGATENVETEDEETEDDDLDAPPKIESQSQSQKQGHGSTRGSKKRRSPTPKSPSPQASPVRRKRGGFTIGGHKAKKAETRNEADEASEVSSATQEQTESQAMSPKRGKGFKIGGRNRAPTGREKTASTSPPPVMQSSRSRTVTEQPSSAAEGVSEHTATLTSPQEEKQLHEETPEERAERRRQELKRKNEELAKQQAHKRKRRF